MTVTYLPYNDIEDDKVRANFEYIENNAVFSNKLGYCFATNSGNNWSGTFGGFSVVPLFTLPMTIYNPSGAFVRGDCDFSCYTTVGSSIMNGYMVATSQPPGVSGTFTGMYWQSSRFFFNQVNVHTQFSFRAVTWDSNAHGGGFNVGFNFNNDGTGGVTSAGLKLPPGAWSFQFGCTVPTGSSVTFDLNDGGSAIVQELP